MNFIDLHVHSTASDGTLTPTQIVTCAAEAGLSAIALTDHDTTAGVAEALKAAEARNRRGLSTPRVIPGAELSCIWHHREKETEIHILGLFLPCENTTLKAFLTEMMEARKKRNDEILRRLSADGICISHSDLVGENPDTVITRAHFATALIKKGYASNIDQVFKKYLNSGGKYCPPKEAAEPERAVRLILECGGFPVLAHPMRYHLSWKEIEELTALLAKAGLMGLEVYYSSHTKEQSQRLRTLGRRFGLLSTGGSDFHGAKKPDIHIGTGYGGLRVPKTLLDDIESALRQKQ